MQKLNSLNLPFTQVKKLKHWKGNKEEQEVLQQANQFFGGAIFTEESFNKYYPNQR